MKKKYFSKTKEDENTLYYVDEKGAYIVVKFDPDKNKIIFDINFPELKKYYYYKEFTYEEIAKSCPLFTISEILEEIYSLIKESIKNFGMKVILNENEETLYLIIPIKINSKKREIKIELNKEYFTKEELITSIIERTNILLDERKSILEIKSIKEIKEEGDERKIFNSRIEELENQLAKISNGFNELNENNLIARSNIISSKEEAKIIYDLLKEMEKENRNTNNYKYQNKNDIMFKLVYKASINGDSSKEFHQRCDKIGPNITLVKTDKNIKFGGFTNNNWDLPEKEKEEEKTNKDGDDDEDNDDNDNDDNKADSGAFCFSITYKKVYKHNSKKEDSICCSRRKGPTFCNDFFCINNNMLKDGGYCSKKDNSCFEGQKINYEISGGHKKFKIQEVEVYEIITI